MTDATWKARPHSGDYNTGTNWTGSVVPDGTAFFGVLDTTHLIYLPTSGFVGGWTTLDALQRHHEWTPPSDRPTLAQGSVAGVPAKLWIVDDDHVLLVAAAAHADVLGERLRWARG